MTTNLFSSFFDELLKIAAESVSPYEIHLSPEERSLNRYFERGGYFLDAEGRKKEKRRKKAEDDDLEERTGYKNKEAASSAVKAESFHTAEVKNWPGFEKDLKSKAFQKAMLGHDLTDSKLKKYVKNYGGQLTSKSIIAVAPSRTDKGKEYKVKVLPTGRLACECKDWQYRHSIKKSDCDHIAAVRHFYRAGLVKTSSSVYTAIGRGMRLKRMSDISKRSRDEGKAVYQRFKQPEALHH